MPDKEKIIKEGKMTARKAAAIFVLLYWLHLLLRMNNICCAAAGVWFWFSFSRHKEKNEIQGREWEELEEAFLYMDLLLHSFQKEEKVYQAMEDVMSNLPDGRLKKTVRLAWHHLEEAYDENAIMEKAVEQIEREFPLKRLHTIHSFMLQAEYYGGNISGPTDILLEDRRRWETRLRKDQKERRHMFTQIILSAAASLLICSIVMYMPVKNMDISQNPLVQLMTLLVLAGDDLIIGKAQDYLRPAERCSPSKEENSRSVFKAGKILRIMLKKEKTVFSRGKREKRERNPQERKLLVREGKQEKDIQVKIREKELQEKLREYRSYREKKEKHISVMVSLIPGALSFIFLFVEKKWFAGASLLLTAFLFNQHRIGHDLQRKKLTEAIRCCFPEWMMQIALLLQGDNVHMAIEKSLPEAPGLLKDDLQKLLRGIEKDPEAAAPYHNFLKEFSLPEVHSAMSGLYAIAAGNCSNSKKQFDQLIADNMDMQDGADTHRLQEETGGMYLLFLLPVATASAKLLVDMTIFLIGFTAYL